MKGWLEANMNGKELITRELLEACKYAMGCIDGTIRDYKDKLPKKLKEAIRKAEGK